MEISNEEMNNLKGLKKFQQLKWYTDEKVYEKGALIGQNVFTEDNVTQTLYRKEQLKAIDHTGLAVLSK